MEGKHLGTEQVLAGGETGGKLELVGHVLSTHYLVGPLAIDVVKLIDLEPRSNACGILCRVDRPEEHVCDGAGVSGLIPLDFDGVALVRSDGVGDASLSVDITSHVLARDIGHRAVRRRHPNANLVAWRFPIDPELVEVLMG